MSMTTAGPSGSAVAASRNLRELSPIRAARSYTDQSTHLPQEASVSQHMVIFQNPEGDPGYNQFESIEEAVSFVEKIRNEQNIDSIRIFELDEVKFDLKPYYKVELLALKAGSPAPAPAPAAAPAPAPAPAPAAPAPAPAPAPAAAPAPAPEPAPAPAEPASPFAAPSSPEPSSGFPPPSSAPAAPTPPADEPEDPQPTRRGLFGR